MPAQGAIFAGAADAMPVGGIIVPEFQTTITDLVRRAGVLGQRIRKVPALGSIDRWFEETSIGDGQFTDPHNISPTATSPVRVEKSLLIRSITNRIDYSLFDMETVAQQGQFAYLKGQDMADMVNGILRLRDKKLWTGADTVSGNQVGGGNVGSFEYVGLLNQLTTSPITIASGASIIDSLRTQVATLCSQDGYNVRPTAIYMNPLALDALEKEAKNTTTAMKFIQSDITDGKVGIAVTGLVTAAGVLPLIPETYLAMNAAIPGVSAAPAGQNNYPFAILTEDLVEFRWIGSEQPRVFQLGTLATLNESYVGVHFGSVLAKGAAYAHRVGVVQF